VTQRVTSASTGAGLPAGSTKLAGWLDAARAVPIADDEDWAIVESDRSAGRGCGLPVAVG